VKLDIQACARILEEGPAKAKELGLREDLFVDEGKIVYTFIIDHFRAHGQVPDVATIKAETNIDLSDPAPEPLSFYAEKLFLRKMQDVVSGHTKTMVDHLAKRAPIAAVDVARRIIGETMDLRPSSKAFVDIREGLDERVKERMRIEDLHGAIPGILTPWPQLDNVTRGINKGDFWVVIASTQIGKSFALVLFMREAVRQGERPLLVSMEMQSSTIIDRFDAMYSEIAYQDFRSGLLGVDGIDRYIAMLKKMAGEQPMWVAGNGLIQTPADVGVLIQDLKPTMVLIDGLYLMQPSMGKWPDKYKRVSMVVDEISTMVQRLGTPIIGSTQFNRTLKTNTLKGYTEQVGYAYEIMQNAHVVIGLFRDDDLTISNRMIVTLMKQREGKRLNMLVNWDLDNMNFEFIGEVSAEDLEPAPGKGKAKFTF